MDHRFLCALLLVSVLLSVPGQAPFGPSGVRAGPGPIVQPDTLPDEPRTVVLDQPDVPVRLTTYEADYDDVRLFQSGGIRHEVAFQNATSRRIVAFKLGFVMYSVFNDIIGRESGAYLEPLASPGRDSKVWTHDPPDAPTFHIGVVYVDKVRYADGEIWTAPASTIQEQLDQIDRDGVDALPPSPDGP